MKSSLAYLVVGFFLWLTGPKCASAQAAVEAGLGASRAAVSSAPAKGIGKSIAGLAGKVEKATETKPEVVVVKTTTDSKPAEPVVSHEDPSGIETSLPYDELIRRFGPGSMSMTIGAEKSMTYRGKEGTYRVKVKDGSVASVEKPQ